MQLVIDNAGMIRCLYHEEIDISSLGRMNIARGSHVEPDEHGLWFADLSPANGPKLGPFSRRSQALEAEADWLETNWLVAAVTYPLPPPPVSSLHTER
jgi:hypothetical protein